MSSRMKKKAGRMNTTKQEVVAPVKPKTTVWRYAHTLDEAGEEVHD